MRCTHQVVLVMLLVAAAPLAANFRHPRYLVYPPRGAYKLVAGLAIPMESPRGQYIAWTINFQFQYALPGNITELPGLPRVRRSLRAIDRPALYSNLEGYLEGRGLPGRPCVRRMVCEASAVPIRHDSLVSRILHVVLTPSRGVDEKLHPEYHDAELLGQNGVNCRNVAPECPTDLLGLVSEIHDEL